MKKLIVLAAVMVIVSFGVNGVFSAPVGNPLMEPAKGDLLFGCDWTLIDGKDLDHADYSIEQEYKVNLYLAKFTYGLLDGLTVNGKVGVGRVKNVTQSVPHGNEAAWGGGVTWTVLKNLHSIWPKIPEKLPGGIDFGFSGQYIGIASNGDNPHPFTLATSSYEYDERWREYQGAAWLAKDLGGIVPYAGITASWVDVRQKEDPNTGVITIRALKDSSDFGYVAGFDLIPDKIGRLGETRIFKYIKLSFEVRAESEKALTAGASWVWKY